MSDSSFILSLSLHAIYVVSISVIIMLMAAAQAQLIKLLVDKKPSSLAIWKKPLTNNIHRLGFPKRSGRVSPQKLLQIPTDQKSFYDSRHTVGGFPVQCAKGRKIDPAKTECRKSGFFGCPGVLSCHG
ncbi:hypothetical protein PoB_002843700 [Plakobranchus ocellatus]|uniref:Uncharacterized protein n=1 Tax=Plakobranchus ocellatus TaxID=259542 RepID=A0AAV4A502_9GAST|nr:hypothetical protein PoB_002843700 [Plakobranchus ocellatus]